MRFTVAAAFLAGSAFAATESVSTDYVTEMVTITSCGPTVTNCPAESTVVSSTVIPMTTSTVYTTKVSTITSCPPSVVKCPAHSTVEVTETIPVSTTVCPVSGPSSVPGPWNNSTMLPPTKSASAPGGGETGAPCPGGENCPLAGAPTTTEAPACPSMSVTSITKSYTTVLTTVEVSTVEVPCPTAGESSPSASFTPSVTGPPAGGNTTVPTTPPTAGAASFAGSAVFAAVAGVAAYILA